MFDLTQYLKDAADVVNQELDRLLPPETEPPSDLHRAMRYSVMNGGKRLRPIISMAAAEAAGGDTQDGLRAGLSVEILHCYTLVHDDLPCMDDDDLRRGKPTTHIAFSESMAVLAGDALLTLAFEWLAAIEVPPPFPAGQLVMELARGSGSKGVIGGQVADLAAEGKAADEKTLRYIHTHKTAMLFRAAARMGAIAGGASPADADALGRYGMELGRAFQITDDLLNTTSTALEMGKPVGNDQEREKMTWVSVFGSEQARHDASEAVAKAREALAELQGPIEPLAALAEQVLTRSH
jgi:geranylgeranyl diphosphate synthase type II